MSVSNINTNNPELNPDQTTDLEEKDSQPAEEVSRISLLNFDRWGTEMSLTENDLQVLIGDDPFVKPDELILPEEKDKESKDDNIQGEKIKNLVQTHLDPQDKSDEAVLNTGQARLANPLSSANFNFSMNSLSKFTLNEQQRKDLDKQREQDKKTKSKE